MQAADDDVLERIRANAQLVIERLAPLSDVEFGYNAQSIAWVGEYIERQRARASGSENLREGLVNTLGAFLGECIIRCYGGSWRREGDTWCVAFDQRNAVYPFNKVRKQLLNGPEDSIAKLFEEIPVLFRVAPTRRP